MHVMNALPRFIAMTAFAVVAALGVGVLIARGQMGSDTPTSFVTQAAFDAEDRALREEIFNLRQQTLEQRVLNAGLELGNSIVIADGNQDANARVAACARARDQAAVFEALWKQIQDFWPLASNTFGVLDGFEKNIRDLCGSGTSQ